MFPSRHQRSGFRSLVLGSRSSGRWTLGRQRRKGIQAQGPVVRRSRPQAFRSVGLKPPTAERHSGPRPGGQARWSVGPLAGGAGAVQGLQSHSATRLLSFWPMRPRLQASGAFKPHASKPLRFAAYELLAHKPKVSGLRCIQASGLPLRGFELRPTSPRPQASKRIQASGLKAFPLRGF